ncbi:hypothetical protein K458DRAFT_45264 [Lentithecium fluviatile CBS 122367]|uniref:Uncharacterized protein n=1 Tax=Lentithecium fluviatile CBS 122367 TaxID=1168545 RepID=A0A6G1IZG2_9PLEO|nr:hypothetical protein K458DRAFT_45264 [Lentithecium fluviatile CBS 122367]
MSIGAVGIRSAASVPQQQSASDSPSVARPGPVSSCFSSLLASRPYLHSTKCPAADRRRAPQAMTPPGVPSVPSVPVASSTHCGNVGLRRLVASPLRASTTASGIPARRHCGAILLGT